tara:strand:+ start:2946 stop:3239 length:294 start_codon:yes stop_codon:yes gene_type:complete
MKDPEYDRWHKIFKRYGLTKQEYKNKRKKQGNKCSICKSELTSPKVDHCHKTGKVRDLLCHKCNLHLGYVEKGIKYWAKASMYVLRHRIMHFFIKNK